MDHGTVRFLAVLELYGTGGGAELGHCSTREVVDGPTEGVRGSPSRFVVFEVAAFECIRWCCGTLDSRGPRVLVSGFACSSCGAGYEGYFVCDILCRCLSSALRFGVVRRLAGAPCCCASPLLGLEVLVL